MSEAPPSAPSHRLSSAATNGPVEVLPGHVTEETHYNQSFSTSQVPVGVAPDGSTVPSFAVAYPSQVALREVARSATPPSRASPQRQQQQYQLPNEILATTPELKPSSLSVPLPSAPLTANILDSLDGGLGKEAPLKPASLVASRARDHPLGKSPGALQTGGNPLAASAKGAALQTQQQQHLQKVIEVQRSHLALLQEIFAKSGSKAKESGVESGSGGRYLPGFPPPSAASGSQGHVTSGGALAASVMDRTQTFDYGNHSNKALEFRAALEKDGYYGGKDARWP